MPAVFRKAYTRAIPDGATHITVERKGVQIPAVRYIDGRGRKVVARLCSDGQRCLVPSPCWYGRVEGQPVRLCSNKAAAEAMLGELISKAQRRQSGLEDSRKEHHSRKLLDHLADYRQELETRGNAEKPYGPGGLIIDEQLERTVRGENAAAVWHWWGMGRKTVIKWRRALGVDRLNNEGSLLLIHPATAKALEAASETGLTEEECKHRRRHGSEVRPKRFATPHATHGKEWMPEDIAVLGLIRNSEVAPRKGHTLHSVRNRRKVLSISAFKREGPTGASFAPRTGCWCASIRVRGRQVTLGTHDTREEAQHAYLETVRWFRG